MQLLIFALISAAFVSAIRNADQKESSSQQRGNELAQSQFSEVRTYEELGQFLDGASREMNSLRNSDCMDLFSYKRVVDLYIHLNDTLSSFDMSNDQLTKFRDDCDEVKRYTFRTLNVKAASTCKKRQEEQELCIHFTFAKFADDVHEFTRAVERESHAVKNFEKLALNDKNSVKNSLRETLQSLNELQSVDLSSWSSEPNFKAVQNELTESVFKLSEYHKRMDAQGHAFR